MFLHAMNLWQTVSLLTCKVTAFKLWLGPAGTTAIFVYHIVQRHTRIQLLHVVLHRKRWSTLFKFKFSVKFVGCCFMQHSQVPYESRCDQKIHHLAILWVCECPWHHIDQAEDCSRRQDQSSRNRTLQIWFLFMAECNPLSQSVNINLYLLQTL